VHLFIYGSSDIHTKKKNPNFAPIYLFFNKLNIQRNKIS
jgi:hypothetical protein